MDTEVLGLGCKLQPVTPPCEPSNPCEVSKLDCDSSVYSDTIPSLLLQMLAILTNPHSRKKVTIDDINGMHLAVLKKENLTLDLEIENLKLKEKEITLRIMKLESGSNSH